MRGVEDKVVVQMKKLIGLTNIESLGCRIIILQPQGRGREDAQFMMISKRIQETQSILILKRRRKGCFGHDSCEGFRTTDGWMNSVIVEPHVA